MVEGRGKVDNEENNNKIHKKNNIILSHNHVQ